MIHELFYYIYLTAVYLRGSCICIAMKTPIIEMVLLLIYIYCIHNYFHYAQLDYVTIKYQCISKD